MDEVQTSVITTWGKVWRFIVGLIVGGTTSALAASFIMISLFSNYLLWLSWLTGDAATILVYSSPLISSVFSLLLFFFLRRKYPYLAYGILTGLVIVAVALVVLVSIWSIFSRFR